MDPIAEPIIISPVFDAVGNFKWRASVQIEETVVHQHSGESPMDALAKLATTLAMVLRKDREIRRQEREEARLRESR